MINDKFLQALVERQTELFNANAPEQERIVVFMQIQDYKKMKRVEKC